MRLEKWFGSSRELGLILLVLLLVVAISIAMGLKFSLAGQNPDPTKVEINGWKTSAKVVEIEGARYVVLYGSGGVAICPAVEPKEVETDTRR